MNKTLFVVLAVCILSVHAFVKRDAPAAPEKPAMDADAIWKKAQEMAKNFGDQISEAIKPDNVKKNFDEVVGTISKTFDSMKPKETPKA